MLIHAPYQEDSEQILTPLGREQSHRTGQRLAEIIKGIDETFGPCYVKTLRVSDMTRAKETAEIIGQHLPDSVVRMDPDPNLNEGLPCHSFPGESLFKDEVEEIDEGHSRLEAAFNTYFYRADEPEEEVSASDSEGTDEEVTIGIDPQHEFEIIVCHANVIRYFFCRALQLPPEAWLRLNPFNCSFTYLTIYPSGPVR